MRVSSEGREGCMNEERLPVGQQIRSIAEPVPAFVQASGKAGIALCSESRCGGGSSRVRNRTMKC